MGVIIPDGRTWVCPDGKCQGDGEIFNPADRRVYRCPCWPKLTQFRAIIHSGLPEDYRRATFDALVPDPQFPNQQQVLDRVRAYATDWPVVKRSGRCLTIISGRTHMGKSHMAAAVCLSLIENWWTESVETQDVCFFVHVPEWFGRWQRHFERFPPAPDGSRAAEERFDNPTFMTERAELNLMDDRMLRTELLVLDDVARFDPTPSRLSRLFTVVEKRTANNLPIVVTDNSSKLEDIKHKLGDSYGAPIVERLDRKGETIVIHEQMRRRGKKS